VSYLVRFAPRAAEDLQRLFDFLADEDPLAAERARTVIAQAMELLRNFPFACRKVSPDTPFLREMIIDFGRSGYVALYEIEDAKIVTVLAVRHQREEDFY
jgi:plasmid stabilization system protein ParE